MRSQRCSLSQFSTGSQSSFQSTVWRVLQPHVSGWSAKNSTPFPNVFYTALWGWYTDRSPSRRVPFLLSLLVAAGATVMIWRASNIALQVVGRVLQGCAAAFVWITGLAMIADTTGQADVGQSLSYLGMAMMIGT